MEYLNMVILAFVLLLVLQYDHHIDVLWLYGVNNTVNLGADWSWLLRMMIRILLLAYLGLVLMFPPFPPISYPFTCILHHRFLLLRVTSKVSISVREVLLILLLLLHYLFLVSVIVPVFVFSICFTSLTNFHYLLVLMLLVGPFVLVGPLSK